MNLERSIATFTAAQELIPGGVNSPVRAYKSVGGTPVHMASGQGPYVTDIDGNEYVDLVLSYGPLILGHANPEVTEAVVEAARRGTTFGAPTEGELGLARRIVERVGPVEVVRAVNSGTEATMSLARLARAATGRERILKFNGCYHGHGDSFLVKAGSGALTQGDPDSPGVPADLASLTLVAEYNDAASVRALFEEHPGEIAAIFVEPVAGNMGLVPPVPGFLEELRAICDGDGALLVYDEVMTGFRVAPGGYLDLTPAQPDLVGMGKVIGGGLPIAAYGGKRELMRHVAPSGKVYQAGTLSGNPVAVAAGDKQLEILGRAGVYETLESIGHALQSGLESLLQKHSIPGVVQRQGSMLCLYFSEGAVTRFDDVTASDRERWTRFFHAMLENGVHLPPSPYEAWFLSTTHDPEAIGRILEAADRALGASQGVEGA